MFIREKTTAELSFRLSKDEKDHRCRLVTFCRHRLFHYIIIHHKAASDVDDLSSYDRKADLPVNVDRPGVPAIDRKADLRKLKNPALILDKPKGHARQTASPVIAEDVDFAQEKSIRVWADREITDVFSVTGDEIVLIALVSDLLADRRLRLEATDHIVDLFLAYDRRKMLVPDRSCQIREASDLRFGFYKFKIPVHISYLPQKVYYAIEEE